MRIISFAKEKIADQLIVHLPQSSKQMAGVTSRPNKRRRAMLERYSSVRTEIVGERWPVRGLDGIMAEHEDTSGVG